MQDAKTRIRAAGTQVKFAKIALDGVRQAYEVSQRTSYDVLDAEQDLSNAEISQIVARRDHIIATYAVALATGSLDYPALKYVLRHFKIDSAAAIAAAPEGESVRATKQKKSKNTVAKSSKCKRCKKPVEVPGFRPSLFD